MNDRRESDKLGFWSIVLLAINSIIGSGIFLTPGSVVSRVGSKALLVYLIAASFAAILAITFAAAAKYVTKSGAAYAYSKAAFGENVGFYRGTTLLFRKCSLGGNGCSRYKINNFNFWWRSK